MRLVAELRQEEERRQEQEAAEGAEVAAGAAPNLNVDVLNSGSGFLSGDDDFDENLRRDLQGRTGPGGRTIDPAKLAQRVVMAKARHALREAYDERMDVIQQDLADQVDLLRGDCLGQDRYFNTYWVVRGVPGILVERCDLTPSEDYAAPLIDAIEARTAALRQARGLTAKRRHEADDDDDDENEDAEEEGGGSSKKSRSKRATQSTSPRRRASSRSADQSPAPDSRPHSVTAGDGEENADGDDTQAEEGGDMMESELLDAEALATDSTAFAFEDPARALPSGYDARKSFFFKLKPYIEGNTIPSPWTLYTSKTDIDMLYNSLSSTVRNGGTRGCEKRRLCFGSLIF